MNTVKVYVQNAETIGFLSSHIIFSKFYYKTRYCFLMPISESMQIAIGRYNTSYIFRLRFERVEGVDALKP